MLDTLDKERLPPLVLLCCPNRLVRVSKHQRILFINYIFLLVGRVDLGIRIKGIILF